MTARERARLIGTQILEQSDDCRGVSDCLDLMEKIIASAMADAERGVWRNIWNESVRIQCNGSPMTDFGKGVIAATKDIQAFICEQSEAQAGKEG